jgi:hypothetical protein
MNEYLMVDTREEQNYFDKFFTPLRIENTQSASSSSLITAPEGGVLNERMCKSTSGENTNYYINSEFPEYKHMKGGLINGFQQLLAFYGNVQIESYHGMVQEFGTVNFSGIPIFINMRLANFIKYHKPRDDKHLKKKMYDSFNPPSVEYQEQCIVKGWNRFSDLLSL